MAETEHMVEKNSENNAENPTRKLKKNILDNFSKLSHQNEIVRVKAAVNLLRYLQENSTNGSDNEIKYALKRLIRGLGSSASTARVGYYSSLTALFNFNNDFTIPDVLEIVHAELHKAGKNSDGENADISTGQILTVGAIIHSSLWDKGSPDDQIKIIQLLLNASKERTYLGLLGYSFLLDLIDKLNECDVKKTLWPVVQGEVSKKLSEHSLDSLFLLLSLKKKCGGLIGSKFLKKSLGTPEVVCLVNYEDLGNVLMNIPRATAVKHPVYDEIIKSTDPKILAELVQVFDQHLRAPNRNRLLLFLRVVTSIYANFLNNNDAVNSPCVPNYLTPNFIRQLLGYFRTFKGNNKDREYQESVYKLFEALLNYLKLDKVDSETKILVLKKFLFTPGTFIFEKLTKSKIVQQITLTLDTEGVKKLAHVYRGVVQGTEKIDSEDSQNETWLNNDRLYGAHLLIKLLNHQSMKEENEWKVEQLIFFMDLALLKGSKGINIGRELADALKTAFFGALDLKLSKLEDLQFILLKLIQNLDCHITTETYNTVLRNAISCEQFEIWQKTVHTLNKIEKKGGKKQKSIKRVFFTLFLHMGLQLFNDAKLAADSLNELFACYQRTRKNRKNSDSSEISIDLEVTSDNELHWIEVVTDLFLNLLSHNSHLLRNIIKCVFPHLCQYMSSTTINQILSVLDPKNDDNPLTSKNEDSDEDDSSKKDEDSDKEEDTDSEDEEQTEQDDDSDDQDEKVTDKLRIALQQALSSTGNQSDDESVDLDEMSDTEAEKLDKALAEAFRQFKPNLGKLKKQAKDQETLTHFRVRVLDLIDIYLDSSPSMSLTLEIMLPLLQALEFSIKDDHQKPLTDRLKACLRKLLQLKKFSDFEGVSDMILSDLLKSLLEKGTKNALVVQDMGEQIANCCIFIVKCSEIVCALEGTPKTDAKALKKSITELISSELVSFLTKRDCLTPFVLFKNILQMNWHGNFKLAKKLLNLIFSDDVKAFKKNQACELLRIFYNNQRLLRHKPTKFGEKLAQSHNEFSNKTIEYFTALCGNPETNITEKTVCSIFNLLSAVKNCPLKIDETVINWSNIAELVREYRSYKTFSNDAKTAFAKLCRSLGVSNVVKMKNNNAAAKVNGASIDTENSVITNNKSSKKKKRKNNESLQLKKEAKKLRLQSLSEGFSNHMDFMSSENDIEDKEPYVNGSSAQSEEQVVVKKKKKN